MKPWFYNLMTFIFRVFSLVAHPVKVVGAENIPGEGPVILCANHQSAQDPFLMATYTKRKIHFMAKKELFDTKVIGAIVTALGAFPVARGENDIAAVRTSLKVLSEGGVLGIFPEGHRYHDGQMHRVESGVSLIALRSQAAVVPAYIDGDYKLFRHMTFRIGKRVDLSDFGRKMDADTLLQATDRISDSMKELVANTKN